MESNITPHEREKMKKFLQEHPINPEYDDECEFLDGNPPEDQLTARLYQAVLDEIRNRNHPPKKQGGIFIPKFRRQP